MLALRLLLLLSEGRLLRCQLSSLVRQLSPLCFSLLY